MSLLIFQANINLLHNFVKKLERERIPLSTQKILIKAYADHLRMELTDEMIEALISD
ncbi:MAG: hypothetical protein N4A62_15675 [Marinisporobacter sp.]|jgi:hypothetical protein|nr:hypothetical protein [Marinisporobacter sp.]